MMRGSHSKKLLMPREFFRAKKLLEHGKVSFDSVLGLGTDMATDGHFSIS